MPYQETFRNWGPVLWAETHDELRYGSGEWDTVLREGWFGGVFEWALLHPRIEFPPFDNELSFVVARTGGCVDLREQPGEGSPRPRLPARWNRRLPELRREVVCQSQPPFLRE